MANILLGNFHQSLIKTAINMGDWLLTLDKLTEQDKNAIKSVQQVLKKLPKVNDGTLAMYGFSIESGDENQGLVRGWDISLEYFADDLDRQGGLEMFSSYIPIPETTDLDVLSLKKQSEVYFHWPIGDVCNSIQPEQVTQWVNEVSQPLQFMKQGDMLSIEIVYQDFYSEIELS